MEFTREETLIESLITPTVKAEQLTCGCIRLTNELNDSALFSIDEMIDICDWWRTLRLPPIQQAKEEAQSTPNYAIGEWTRQAIAKIVNEEIDKRALPKSRLNIALSSTFRQDIADFLEGFKWEARCHLISWANCGACYMHTANQLGSNEPDSVYRVSELDNINFKGYTIRRQDYRM